MKNKTILIVDDVVENLDILIDFLEDYDVIDVTSGKEAIEVVQNEKVDLILLDIMMPEIDGFEVCRILKTKEESKDIPIIFLTARDDEESIEKAFELGGNDYITKPFKPIELKSRVNMQLKLQDLQNELKMLAITDFLSGLYNRRYFFQISKHILEIARREKKSIAIIMFDIDKFKNINDIYGHQVGDKVIVEFSKILQSFARDTDLICRYGGEEFLILLVNSSLRNAVEVANRIRKNVETYQLIIEDNKIINFTVSAGVSLVDFDSEKDVSNVIKRSDDALYAAKNNGRNRVETKILQQKRLTKTHLS